MSKAPKFFSTSQVAAVLGVSLRRVISYVERGYIAATIQEASGHGSRRLWSYNDIVRCAIIKDLSSLFSVEALRNIGEWLQEDARLDKMHIWVQIVDAERVKDPNGLTLHEKPSHFHKLADEERETPDQPWIPFSAEHFGDGITDDPAIASVNATFQAIEESAIRVVLNMEKVHRWVQARIEKL